MTCLALSAQTRFTDKLQQLIPGQGRVVIYQDAVIEQLVNGVKHVAESAVSHATTKTPTIQSQDTLTATTTPSQVTGGKTVRATGFRVQVYAGGNSRDAKSKAAQMASQVRMLFPGYAVYTRFVSPRWICHVGDFRTREEAAVLLREMRAIKGFDESIIVKCKVNLSE